MSSAAILAQTQPNFLFCSSLYPIRNHGTTPEACPHRHDPGSGRASTPAPRPASTRSSNVMIVIMVVAVVVMIIAVVAAVVMVAAAETLADA